jgi:hypothetical protein
MSVARGSKLAVLVIVSGALAGAGAGCGSNALGTCGKEAPCGGDVVGTWTLVGGCLNESAAIESCPGASIDVADISASGTLSFSADGHYTADIREQVHAHETVPLTCTGASGSDCAALNQSAQGDRQTLMLTCTGSTTCDCTITSTVTLAGEGSYTVSGTTLSGTGDLGAPSFCVKDDVLHLMGVRMSVNADGMATTTVISDLVAQRHR